MAISVVQTASGTGNPPVTFASNVTAGNTVFLVAPVYNTGGTNNSISGVKLGTTTVTGTVAFFNNSTTGGVNSASSGGNVAYISIWMLPNCPGGNNSVDYTPSGSQVGQVAFEVSGLGSSPSLDQSTSNSGITTGALSSGTTGAITAAPELIIGGAMIFAGATGNPAGFTVTNPTADCYAGYQIATSSGGTYTWSQTTNGNPWAVALATVQGTAAPPPPFRLLVSAPWRPAPPPRLLAAQVITAPLPAPPFLPAAAVQAGGIPFRAPWQVAPQVVTSLAQPPAQGSAALSGLGTLTAAPVLAGSASLSGAGTLSAATTTGTSVSLSGTGTLSAVTTTGTTAALSGSGTLTALWTLSETLTLSGSGTLSVSQNSGSANLTGLGTLTAAPQLQGAASLTGLGTLTAAWKLGEAFTLTGTGTLTAAPALTSLASAALSGIGTLSVPPVFQVARSTASVTDPRDGTATVAAAATSTPGVT